MVGNPHLHRLHNTCLFPQRPAADAALSSADYLPLSTVLGLPDQLTMHLYKPKQEIIFNNYFESCNDSPDHPSSQQEVYGSP